MLNQHPAHVAMGAARDRLLARSVYRAKHQVIKPFKCGRKQGTEKSGTRIAVGLKYTNDPPGTQAASDI
jgi:hypothetical protein